jgi:CheY-like chemotaxis protein
MDGLDGSQWSVDTRAPVDLDRPAADAARASDAESDLRVAPHVGQRILVLDPDPAARGRLAEALNSAGYAVWQAADATAALEQLQASPPALVFADTGASGANGEAFFALWTRACDQCVPLVLTSTSTEDQELARRLDAIGCLRKPYLTEEILATAALLCDAPALRAARPAGGRHLRELAGLVPALLGRVVSLLQAGAHRAAAS